MDAYPPEYVDHNLPLIVLSGLEPTTDHGVLPPVQDVLPGRATITLSAEIPAVTGERAQQLLHELLSADGRDAPWNARGLNHRGNTIAYRMRTAGRVGQANPDRTRFMSSY
jgi:trafficking protein particle complex subunit 11